MEKRLLNIKELSEYLGIPVNTLYCWVSSGKIPKVKLGRLVKFDIQDINQWIENNKLSGLKNA